MEMRKVLASELENIMLSDKDVVILNADLERPNGLSGLRKNFHDRMINVGIAEQNMASIAAGMSSYGYKPIIFTFTPFATRRICDQIAISICYANQNVKIIGTDPGITAEYNGGTHMSMEDIGVLRSIPNIVICEPADEFELKSMLPQVIEYQGAVYMRMSRKEIPKVFDEGYKTDLFKGSRVTDGDDVTIVCSGIMVSECMEAYKKLKDLEINAEIINIHTIKPLDCDIILDSAKKTRCLLTVENHNIIGGLYSAVCESLMSEKLDISIMGMGIKDLFGQVGKLPYLKEVYELRSEDIVKKVLRLKHLK